MRMLDLKKLALASTALVGILAMSSPGNATLQIAATINGSNFFCADQTACDLNLAVGTLDTGAVTIGGVTFNGSEQIQTNGPPSNSLTTSSFSIINGTGSTATIAFAVGATDFPGAVTGYSASGSGTWLNAGTTSTVQMGFYADPTNTQGADNALDLPGTLLVNSPTFTSTGGPGTDAYSFTHPDAFPMDGPYSWTMAAAGTLISGGRLIGRSQDLVADVTPVPEPASLGILGLGLLGTGLALRRRRNSGNGGLAAA